jgi:hypothetical protein
VFKAVLYTQWKWTRLPLLILALAAFALPLVSARQMAPDAEYWNTQGLLQSLDALGAFYPLLAATVGLILAAAAWAADHRGRHVYALSLPLPRWHYVLLRLGAAGLLLVVPAIAMWLGALIAATVTTLPPGLHAYPTTLALRFALAAFIALTLFFAVSAGTSRTAGYVLGAIGVLVVAQIAIGLFDLKLQILETILYQIYIWPGPLEIFVGRWSLFDV